MKKLVLPIVMAFMMSPMLNAAEETDTDCWKFASEQEERAGGDNFEVFEHAYMFCEENT
ncbi:hypothetical protein [Salegentibacter sp. Hel_I_6]|uniref:hypothetical protein n=1 Tax=Salegentibacter sp. Hel_I_6 TaxID=1250278 RepID=UPI0012E0C25B|nr:hypothetical protein [Salegentibacter sp. Hel_I_6]